MYNNNINTTYNKPDRIDIRKKKYKKKKSMSGYV